MKINLLMYGLILIVVAGCRHKDDAGYITELDHEITLKEKYDKVKEDKIAYLRSLLSQASTDEEKTNLQWDLINEYRNYQRDSVVVYSMRLIEQGESMDSERAKTLGRLGLMDSYTSVGYFKEANDELKLIHYEEIPEEIRPFFLDLAYRLYGKMESFVFDSGSGLKDTYRQKRFDYLKQLLEITDANTYKHDAAQIELNQLSGQTMEDIIRQREMLLKRYKPSEHNNAIQYYKMAISAKDIGKTEEAREYMSKSVMASLRSSDRESIASMDLAEMMNEAGDSKHASQYVRMALDDAEFYGSQLRKVEIGYLLPLIENPGMKKRSHHNIFGVVMLVIACVLLIVSDLLFYALRNRSRKLIEANRKLDQNRKELSQRNEDVGKLHKEMEEILKELKETTDLKDEYILQSLSVNTDFINSIEQKAKNIARQVREKKYDELKFVEHRLGIKEERQRIFKSFDAGFRKMFPNFIDEINRLLPEDERFEIGEDEDLPVDLRIFALIRLGISDPSEIAKYLNLSVKTVYVYKTRMKTKSVVDNTEFESCILSIPKP